MFFKWFMALTGLIITNLSHADNMSYLAIPVCATELDYFELTVTSANYSGDYAEKEVAALADRGFYLLHKPFEIICKLKSKEIKLTSQPRNFSLKYLVPGSNLDVSLGNLKILKNAKLNTISYGGKYITKISVHESSVEDGYVEIQGKVGFSKEFSDHIPLNKINEKTVTSYGPW